MTDILALDIATTTGWARGLVGCDAPSTGSVRFRKSSQTGATDNMVFGACLSWISELLRPEPRPDILIVEAMLPPEAMKGETSRAVRDRLAGLHGVVRGVAHLRGIGEIAHAEVNAVRRHFLGESPKRERAKRETIERCKALGWRATDDNSADACALWSFGCSLIDPAQALRVSPLFNKRLTVRAM
jgi:hypothetical protein